MPRAAVEPLLRSLRMVNTAADALFYDVGVLWPERWIEAWHSTNTMLPLTVPVSKLTAEGLQSAPHPVPG